MPLFADDMILHIQNLKAPPKKVLELINELSKAAGYKNNVQKSVAFLNTTNKLSQREIRKTIPFKTPSKVIRYLGINFNQGGEKPIL